MLSFELANQTYELFPKLDLLVRVMASDFWIVLKLDKVSEDLLGIRHHLVEFLTPVK